MAQHTHRQVFSQAKGQVLGPSWSENGLRSGPMHPAQSQAQAVTPAPPLQPLRYRCQSRLLINRSSPIYRALRVRPRTEGSRLLGERPDKI